MTKPTAPTHCDLVWMQAMTGGAEVVSPHIPNDAALGVLRDYAARANEYGPGSVFYLVDCADPLHQVRKELKRAQDLHAPLNSAHEAYAVILEELDEFKAEVWKHAEARDVAKMRRELIQVAAMAIRAIGDLEL
jgi:hypothetical protein